MKISATIITLNEERNIARALETLAGVDEIVVVDSGSCDRTREIAIMHGARVIEHAWDGYAAQKNFAAEQASHDWVLSLDADEALTELLAAQIQRLRREADGESAAQPAAYRMARRAQYLGRWILHSGWYPDYKLRLYDRRRARWQGAFVHESVESDGPVETLDGDLLHFTCDSLTQHLRTMDHYTTLAAKELRARGRRGGVAQLLFAPPWTFLRTYLVQQGFRDGRQGLIIAAMASFYVFLKWAKTWEADDASAASAQAQAAGKEETRALPGAR